MAKPPKAITAPAQDNFDPAKLEEAGQAAQQLQQLQAGYDQGRDLVNQMLGQIQMSRAISKFTDVVSLSKLKQIKENKMYRAVAGQKGVAPTGDEIPDVGTWEGFCKALGLSVSKVDEDLTNLNVFGEDALNQLNSVGLGYRDLRQFRKLPADQKTALIEAAKEGDKDTLLELAEDLIAKHAKEKEALTKDLTEAQATIEAKDAVLSDKQAQLTKLQVKVQRKIAADIDWPDALIPITDQIAACKRDIDHIFSKLESARIAVLQVEMSEDQRPKFEAALAHVAEVYASALASAERHYLKDQVIFAQTLGAFLPDEEA